MKSALGLSGLLAFRILIAHHWHPTLETTALDDRGSVDARQGISIMASSDLLLHLNQRFFLRWQNIRKAKLTTHLRLLLRLRMFHSPYVMLTSLLGAAQAVSCWVCSCGICGRQPNSSFFPVYAFPPKLYTHKGLYHQGEERKGRWWPQYRDVVLPHRHKRK